MSAIPLWFWIAGVVVLGGILAYGILQTGRLTRREKQVSQAATKRLNEAERR
jgi:hypothetical protein